MSIKRLLGQVSTQLNEILSAKKGNGQLIEQIEFKLSLNSPSGQFNLHYLVLTSA